MRTAETASLRALAALPATITIPTAGSFFGLSRALAYQLAARGEFPVQVRQVGARFYVVLTDLAVALGVNPTDLLRVAVTE